jgi:hypothetical protein
VPTNADAWWKGPGPHPGLPKKTGTLIYNPTPYGDGHDESVLLAGSGLTDWIKLWASTSGGSLTPDTILPPLAQVILRTHTWCQTCSMFALHQPDVGHSPAEQVQACIQDPLKRWSARPRTHRFGSTLLPASFAQRTSALRTASAWLAPLAVWWTLPPTCATRA